MFRVICSLDVLEHHLGELVERDFSVTVGVDLAEDLLHNFLVEVLAEREHLLDLVN